MPPGATSSRRAESWEFGPGDAMSAMTVGEPSSVNALDAVRAGEAVGRGSGLVGTRGAPRRHPTRSIGSKAPATDVSLGTLVAIV